METSNIAIPINTVEASTACYSTELASVIAEFGAAFTPEGKSSAQEGKNYFRHQAILELLCTCLEINYICPRIFKLEESRSTVDSSLQNVSECTNIRLAII